MSGSNRPVYSIGAASKVLGVPAATLRTWQDRYGVVQPERSRGGHRLYSKDQLEQLRFLAEQVATGISPADAHRLLDERLAHGAGLGQARPRGARPLILLAERDRYAADFAEYFLRAEGYETVLELDADGALARSAELSPDLATVDLLISGGRGLELCRQLSGQAAVPVLATSPLELRDAAIDAGAAAFLRKPIEPLRLVAAVQDLLGRKAFVRHGAATT
jgi:DNA-binding transcriptional MerR regulator